MTQAMDGNDDPLRTGLLNVLAQVEQGRGARSCQTVQILGCHRGAGATTIAHALALAALEAGIGPVLLLDANAARPGLAQRLARPAARSLAETIEAEAGWRTALAEAPGPGPAPGLVVLGPQPFRLLGQASFRAAWAGVEKAFALVVVDSLNLDESPASATIAQALGAQVVLVATAETTAAQGRRVRDMLVRSGAPILGVILNKRVDPLPSMLDRLV